MTQIIDIRFTLIVTLLFLNGSLAGSDDSSISFLKTLEMLLSRGTDRALYERGVGLPPHPGHTELNTRLDDYQKRSGPPKEALTDTVVSPVALYLLKKLMSGPPKLSRDRREDHVITVQSRGGKFPWDDECSRGYKHCGGYFPSCCEGYVCLKPLTAWDVRNGLVRCWPDYFQTQTVANLDATNE